MNLKDFKQEVARFGATLSDLQCQQFETYCTELISWNEKFNLTAITARDDIFTKHFLDSLSILKALPVNAENLIDIGSGAGFPGIALKIARPELTIVLLEATDKKVEFLKHIIAILKLTNIEAIHARAEEFAHDGHYREQFDIATARAVAKLSILAEYALPFLKISGIFIAMKQTGKENAADAEHALQTLGGQYIESLTYTENRELVVVKKIHPTPDTYPRRTGVPSKRPL